MRIARAAVAAVLIILGTLYAEKNMPDDSWLLAAIFLLGVVLAVIQCFIWRGDRRRELRAMKDEVVNALELGAGTVLTESGRNGLAGTSSLNAGEPCYTAPSSVSEVAPRWVAR